MMDNKRKILILGMFFLFGILMVNFVGAEMLVSDAGVEYGSNIMKAFNSSDWVPVIVRFNTINDTLRDSVLISLSSSEFNLDRKNLRGDGFYGNITKKGLNKLINNSQIKRISLNMDLQIHEEDKENEALEDIPSFLKSRDWKQKSLLFGVFFLLILSILFYIIYRKRGKTNGNKGK